MKENYYVLAISILTMCTPEQAFEAFRRGRPTMRECTQDEISEMVQFRHEGLTNQEIAEMYGVTKYCVSRQVNKRLKGA